MNDYMIEAIAQALLDAGVLSDDNPKQTYANAVKVLTKHFQNEIHITWNVEDVQQQARENHIRCSAKRAREVLTAIYREHNAECGVNWDTILWALVERDTK